MLPQSNSDDLTDDESNSSDEHPLKADHPSLEYNGFQISDFPFCFSFVSADLTYDHSKLASLKVS